MRDTTSEPIVAFEVARIYMSPAHAKSVLHLLERVVGAYEQKYGEIAPVETTASEPAST
jgi:hypothetical protein